jgi:hypothetical protein
VVYSKASWGLLSFQIKGDERFRRINRSLKTASRPGLSRQSRLTRRKTGLKSLSVNKFGDMTRELYAKAQAYARSFFAPRVSRLAFAKIAA